MKRSSRLEKWGSGFLGVVCLILILNLVLRSGARVGATRPTTSAARPARAAGSQASAAERGFDDLVRYDPTVHVDALKEIRKRPLPKLERNPFEFRPQRLDAPETGTAAPMARPSAPQPASIPLKALGYTEKAGGIREAIVTDDEQIFIVHEGETFARRFRVIRISPSVVELEDENTQQSVRLPISP